jgi:hypothetical protein
MISHLPDRAMINQPPGAIEMGRSQRVMLRLPIHVRWTPRGEPAITEDATTLVVNAHGALIVLAMRVKAGSLVFIRHSASGQDKVCRVVRVSEKPELKREVAVEFLRADAKFCGLEFPPDDGKKIA